MEDDGSLIIKGIRVNRDVLRKDAVQACTIGQCTAVCCSTGVWLKTEEVPRILEWGEAIKAYLPPDRHDESKWFLSSKPDDDQPAELGTSTVADPLRSGKTCCVFLQTNRKCALHIASQVNNLGWPGLKPYFCAIYPLFFEEGELSVDDSPLDSESASCRRFTNGVGAIYEMYRDEAILILGEEGYRELCESAGRIKPMIDIKEAKTKSGKG